MEEETNKQEGPSISYAYAVFPNQETLTTKVDNLLNIYEFFKDDYEKVDDLKDLIIDKLEKIVSEI